MMYVAMPVMPLLHMYSVYINIIDRNADTYIRSINSSLIQYALLIMKLQVLEYKKSIMQDQRKISFYTPGI